MLFVIVAELWGWSRLRCMYWTSFDQRQEASISAAQVALA